MLNALVIEDHAEMRDWLASLVKDAFQNVRVDAVPTLEQARELAAEKMINVAVVDINLPDGSGIEFVREMTLSSPSTYCVMATIYDDDNHLFGALQAGARGYLLKDQPREKLLQQLGGIMHGDPPLSPGIARRMMQYFQRSNEFSHVEMPKKAGLSERELDVLVLTAKGMRRAEIAEAMAISTHTVAGHLKNIYRKLNITCQAEAAIAAARLGLVKGINES